MVDFNPKVNSTIEIFDEKFVFPVHPTAKFMPYIQEARKALVYQIISLKDDSKYALKVFKQAYKNISIKLSTENLGKYKNFPGLKVADRKCITKTNSPKLISKNPDLEFAILMPWIEGFTWEEIIENGFSFSLEQSLGYSYNLANILKSFEEKQISHGDISGGNVILDRSDPNYGVQLIDIEDIFREDFPKPSFLPAGTPGYGHKISSKGLWGKDSDRFSGAILLCEIISWHDEKIRNQIKNKKRSSYFLQSELQNGDLPAFTLMLESLNNLENRLSDYLIAAWNSKTLNECPELSKWEQIIDFLLFGESDENLIKLFEISKKNGNYKEIIKASGELFSRNYQFSNSDIFEISKAKIILKKYNELGESISKKEFGKIITILANNVFGKVVDQKEKASISKNIDLYKKSLLIKRGIKTNNELLVYQNYNPKEYGKQISIYFNDNEINFIDKLFGKRKTITNLRSAITKEKKDKVISILNEQGYNIMDSQFINFEDQKRIKKLITGNNKNVSHDVASKNDFNITDFNEKTIVNLWLEGKISEESLMNESDKVILLRSIQNYGAINRLKIYLEEKNLKEIEKIVANDKLWQSDQFSENMQTRVFDLLQIQN